MFQESRGKKSEVRGFLHQIPKEPGKKSALVLAGLMHLLLILFLWIGIHWQNKVPVGVEAEIWDMNTRAASPLPTIAALPSTLHPPAEKREAYRSEVPPNRQQKQDEMRDADIALERTQEIKIIEQKRLENQKAKLIEEKIREDKIKEDKAREEKTKEEKQLRINELKKEEKRKQDLAKIAEQKKTDALLQQRADNLKRLTSQLTGQIAGVGDAVKSTGNNRVDVDYAGKIAAKIKSNMAYVGGEGLGNPTAYFVINLFPDGSLRGAPRKMKSSEVPAFDDAVARAITKSAPFPADKSGNVPSTIPLTYKLKD